MQIDASTSTKPPITLIDSEADALVTLALAAQSRSSLAAELLLEEIDRANVVGRGELPTDVVTMRSRVIFSEEGTGEEHSVELVYPREANMEEGRVSVLTPVGAALIGMVVGNSIDWPNRQGMHRRFKIVNVVQPPASPEAAA